MTGSKLNLSLVALNAIMAVYRAGLQGVVAVTDGKSTAVRFCGEEGLLTAADGLVAYPRVDAALIRAVARAAAGSRMVKDIYETEYKCALEAKEARERK